MIENPFQKTNFCVASLMFLMSFLTHDQIVVTSLKIFPLNCQTVFFSFPQTKVAECPNCSQHFASQQKLGEDGENVGEDEKGLQSTLFKLQNQLQGDDQQRISSLENELITAKLDLAEARERADQLELRLYAANAPSAEKSWYKKITNQMKK